MSQESKRRILLVQENSSADLLQQILSKQGHEILITASGYDPFENTLQHSPDLVITEAALPGFDGYDFCRRLRQNEATREMPILMLTSKGEITDKVAGFEAGVDDYMLKPFEAQELIYRVKILLGRSRKRIEPKVEHQGQGRVIALFGTKGGVGRTTIAVNLAVALKRRTRAKVMLFDADFFFGDMALHLNLPPSHTVLDLVERIDQLDQELVDQVLIPHNSGIRVLVSPRSPEKVEAITAAHVERLLEIFSRSYDYVVVDCQASYDERILVVLERADAIILIIKPEVGCIKNMAVFSELAVKLGFPFEKVHIVLNRSGSNSGIDAKEIERIFRRRIAFHVGSGGRAIVVSVNRGIPLMIEQPNHSFSLQVAQIADYMIQQLPITVQQATV